MIIFLLKKNFLILTLISVFFLPYIALGDSLPFPSVNDYWLTTTYTLDEKTLPPGIQYKRSYINYLHNTTSTPLYLKDGRYILLTPNEFMKWPEEKYSYSCMYADRCIKEGNKQTSGSLHLSSQFIDGMSDIDIKNPDNLSLNKNRPRKYSVPSPESYVIPVVFGDKKYEITGTIVYALNDSYKPKNKRNNFLHNFFSWFGKVF